jgi:hypothetical protein
LGLKKKKLLRSLKIGQFIDKIVHGKDSFFSELEKPPRIGPKTKEFLLQIAKP